MVGRYIQYNTENAGKSLDAGLPNIKGEVVYGHSGWARYYADRQGSPFYWKMGHDKGGRYNFTGTMYIDNNSGRSSGIDFDASLASPVYGNSDTVQPNSVILIPIIKY